ncbi:hypothetical protein C4D60_Mb04t15850 [Musa balbisiana]|uniref:SMP-LTD domain-containing protein n=1 Tax=Musa balbisiana TaxID=52838 RepID=A0A4S8KCB6_MUSBA|nr:hypothetical protein C4D60_Mb04t15850 [Musa balbisiana]
MLVSFLFGFVAGFVALVAAEGLAFLWLMGRLCRKRLTVGVASRSQLIARGLDAERSLTVPFEKKVGASNRFARWPFASFGIELGLVLVVFLVLWVQFCVDGLTRLVAARTCNLSTVYGCAQQRAKRYPIKLESNDTKIYKGSKACYLYFDTSWEKESWCKALRLASCPDRGKWNWFSQLGEDFQDYLSSLTADEKFVNDKGTLCWNLLLSRLFFDAKNSIEINNLIKACIQTTLSNTRRPSYLCEISCTGLDLGSVLPYIHRMRVFPVDLNQVLSMEIDIEYSGGIILDIETRLKVRELELQKDLIKTSLESNSTYELNSDFLEGFEHYGNQLKSPSNSATGMGNRNEVDKADGLRNSKSASWTSGCVSRWKAILHSLANQVSQVPLSLSIRVASLCGTLRLYIKPPPSDQLWFGFTTMPELDWNLESSVGDRKITSSHIALLISNRFKAAIRDSLVLPNCETICIPWMLAEKDDWVPRKIAPFMWINNENTEMTWPEFPVPQNTEDKPKLDGCNKTKDSLDDKVDEAKNVIHVEQPM